VIVVDASVLATALGDDGPDGDRARARLRGERLSAPELVDLEVASVLRRQVQGGAVDIRRAALALADLAAMPLRRAPHRPLLARCWELRDNLTVYDASYVALAEALDVTLLAGDGRLARAPGPRCRVEMLRPASLSTPDAACATTSASDPRPRAHRSNAAGSKVDLEVMLTGHATLNDGRGPESARRAVPAACSLRGLKPCNEPGL
jgi:predicted nucleic acid-binding protein